jgi:hypothetical protein
MPLRIRIQYQLKICSTTSSEQTYAGNTETRSASRTPTGLSSRQSPGNVIEDIAGVLPTQ